jgi:hypothetical protein
MDVLLRDHVAREGPIEAPGLEPELGVPGIGREGTVIFLPGRFGVVKGLAEEKVAQAAGMDLEPAGR